MYRRMKSNFGKVKDATFVAGEAMVKGMLVVKNYATGEVELPASAVGTNVFIVDFDPEWTGLLAVQDYVSDYDTRLNTIADGDKVALETLQVGEEYGTDQFTATDIVVGSYLQVGTDGKLAVKASGTSPLVATNIAYDDAGHTLLLFEVTENPFA